ncbi:hypothetical protein [Ruminococcus sp.]|uniref:hypothetical protein n=1 Tax=Ruminococcus sp. TaxID=41978 RepID=UPI0025DA84C7|nr:hypothetical protein [Ruminococcus sp.]
MADETPKAELMIEIINNNLSVDAVKEKIRQLETEYGENYILDYDLEKSGIEIKPQNEWDEEYYEKVKTKGILGIASKQYFLYFAELNQYIQAQRQNKLTEQKKKRQKLVIVVIAIILICMITLILLFNSGAESKATSASEFQMSSVIINDYFTIRGE